MRGVMPGLRHLEFAGGQHHILKIGLFLFLAFDPLLEVGHLALALPELAIGLGQLFLKKPQQADQFLFLLLGQQIEFLRIGYGGAQGGAPASWFNVNGKNTTGVPQRM